MIEDVKVDGLRYSVDGRILELRETASEHGPTYQVWDVTHAHAPRPLTNGGKRLNGALEDAYQILCPQDSAVRGSDAWLKMKRAQNAARIARADARWRAAMASGDPESES
jgi:hypothetical protein